MFMNAYVYKMITTGFKNIDGFPHIFMTWHFFIDKGIFLKKYK